MEFKLPDLGEGVHEGEIVKWLIKEGDEVTENQPLVEVMTDKATVEIPSPAQGKVVKLHFKEGDTVVVDNIIVTLQKEGESAASERKEQSNPSSQKHPPLSSPPGKGGDSMSASLIMGQVTPSGFGVQATPAVRKLAKDLNVDLTLIKGTGPAGRITEEDVQKAKGATRGQTTTEATRFKPFPIPKAGPEERLPLRGLRKTIAHHLQMSKYFAPHFTHVEHADVTKLVEHRNKNKDQFEKKGIKLTYLAYIVKALTSSLKAFPYVNASLDETTQSIVLKKYYNMGVAVDTPDGLVVPVIKDADKKSLQQVAQEIVHLAEAVRNNKAKPEELKGSTFTVTSIGSVGGVFATPILNYPDVAILAVNKIEERPVVVDGKIVIRHMTYFAITSDHRVVDGAVAARFINHLTSTLQNPEQLAGC
ncbi:MAG TPA: dihydrolipoamide acetyltransferase family protein [Bdellovibrionota bacterium]|nr:dihydrolipoamide acetyltransferase family protein [Bdellovibrionota bacterium]